MEHIKRMEEEFKELEGNIIKLQEDKTKAEDFFKKETEEPKFTDEIQRNFLGQQIHHMDKRIYHMIGHREVLRDRIKYDKDKMLK